MKDILPLRQRLFIYLGCLLATLTLPVLSYSQWVPVPQGFADYISTYISAAAINGNLLDTTNSNVITLQNLTISPATVVDITGIEYFDALENLATEPPCMLTSVPRLPNSLLTLDLSNSYATVTSVAAPVPPGLRALKLNGGALNNLPALPSGLTTFYLLGSGNLTQLALPTGLVDLKLRECSINPFPAIPTTVKYLELTGSQYGAVMSMWSGLESFVDYNAYNTTGLSNIPSTLKYLDFKRSLVTSISGLPAYMSYLDLSDNAFLTNVDLPDSVEEILMSRLPLLQPITNINKFFINGRFWFDDCPNADIQTLLGKVYYFDLPFLNYGPWFRLANDNITSLPQIHVPVIKFEVQNNPLGFLPTQQLLDTTCVGINCEYPFTSTSFFDFSNCGLTDINPGFFEGRFPYQYATFYFNNNYLTNITYLPPNSDSYFYLQNNLLDNITVPLDMKALDLSNNQIKCLPYLGARLETLNVSGNPINCIPNVPGSGFVCTPSLPICQPGNSNNCSALALTGGHVFNDLNKNAVADVGEALLPGQNAMLLPDNNIHVSDMNGAYNFNCLVGQPYIIQGVCPFPYRYITTLPDTVNYLQVSTDTLHDIGVYTMPNVNDLIVKVTPVTASRPGFHQQYRVTVKNEGTTIQYGNIVAYFDPRLIYQSSNWSGTVTGNSIEWQFSYLQPLATFDITVDFIVQASIPLGSPIAAGVYAFGNVPDTTLADNHDTIQQVAIGSYDPNDKKVSPANGIAQEQLQNGVYLDYTVRFQNTGTASAINVRIEDTFSVLLDLSSFEILAASHNYHWSIEEGVLKMYFDNIFLPDSANNEPESHGFFRYRIKPKNTSVTGNEILNTALIYFDFNAPVVTNTASTRVSDLFATQPYTQQICSGQHLVLIAKTSVTATNVQWLKDGLPIGFFTDTLNIDSATVTDAGTYTCEVTMFNGDKFLSSAAIVQVNDHPALPACQIITPYNNDSASFIICSTQLSNSPAIYSVLGANALVQPVFRWYVNDTLLGTSDSLSISFTRNWKDGDKLSCYLDGPCFPNIPIAQTTASVISSDTLQVDILASATAVCAGQPITFTAQTKNSINNYAFTWLINGSAVPGYTDSAFTYNLFSNNDEVNVKLTTNANCILDSVVTSNLVKIFVSQPDTPTVSIASTQPGVCQGISPAYVATVTYGGVHPVYEWKVNGGVAGIDSAVFTPVSIANGDSVSCVITSTETCVAATQAFSNIVTALIYPLPVKPVITVVGSNLSSSATNNNWLFNNTFLSGANQNTYTVTQDGFYSVQTVDTNGCVAVSDSVFVLVSSISNSIAALPLIIYPNPAGNVATVSVPEEWMGGSVNISALTGQAILVSKLSETKQTLNTASWARGVYLVSVTLLDGSNYRIKLVLQ